MTPFDFMLYAVLACISALGLYVLWLEASKTYRQWKRRESVTAYRSSESPLRYA